MRVRLEGETLLNTLALPFLPARISIFISLCFSSARSLPPPPLLSLLPFPPPQLLAWAAQCHARPLEPAEPAPRLSRCGKADQEMRPPLVPGRGSLCVTFFS